MVFSLPGRHIQDQVAGFPGPEQVTVRRMVQEFCHLPADGHELVQIDARGDPHFVQHMDYIFTGYIPSCSWYKRTAASPGKTGIELGEAFTESR